MKNFTLILLLIALLFSCDYAAEKYIYYEYAGIVVTRLDKGKQTYFYYGQCDNEGLKCQEPSVEVDWSFNDYLDGFILFHENGIVEVISAGGTRYKSNDKGDSRLLTKEYSNSELGKLLNPYYENEASENLYHIYSIIETEKKVNTNSKVKPTY